MVFQPARVLLPGSKVQVSSEYRSLAGLAQFFQVERGVFRVHFDPTFLLCIGVSLVLWIVNG